MKNAALVVGAGIAGASAAVKLSDAGLHVVVVEKKEHVGGGAADTYDDRSHAHISLYGPHILYAVRPPTIGFFSRFCSLEHVEHRVLSVTRSGGVVPVPFNYRSAEQLGCLRDMLKVRGMMSADVGDQVTISELLESKSAEIRAFGSLIYSEIFDLYTRSMWGDYADDVGKKVTGRVPVRFSYADSYYSPGCTQCRPRDGYSAMIASMLQNDNIEVHCNVDNACELAKIWNGIVIWTAPADELVDYRYGALPYRGIYFREEQRRHSYSRSVVNYSRISPQADVCLFTRESSSRMLCGMDTSDDDVIITEYPNDCNCGERLYPIPSDQMIGLHARYVDYISRLHPNVHLAGRHGQYMYLNMEGAFTSGINAAEDAIAKER